jgi:two-component system response regulator AtoC
VTGTHATAPAGLDDAGAASHHVMLVEDEPSVRRVTARLLTEAGYTVHEMVDGLAALEFFLATPRLVHVVVSDIVMPRLNGVQLLQRLSILYPGLPCILISAYGGPQLAKLGIAEPCGVLTKPVPPEVLLDKVRHCLPGAPEAIVGAGR